MKKIIVFIDPVKFDKLLGETNNFKIILSEYDPIQYKVSGNSCAHINCSDQTIAIEFNIELKESKSNSIYILHDDFSGNIEFLKNYDFKILHHTGTVGKDILPKLQEIESFYGKLENKEVQNTLYDTIAKGIAHSNLDFNAIWNSIETVDKKLISLLKPFGELNMEDLMNDKYTSEQLEEMKTHKKNLTDYLEIKLGDK